GSHKIETEIRFISLLQEIQRNERTSDQVGESGAEDRVNQRGPKQVARNVQRRAKNVQRRGAGKIPENDRERPKRHDRIEQAEAERKNANVRVAAGVDELLD